MIPYSRPKRSDLYTPSKSKLLENHTLHSGTYLYSPYMAVPPPRGFVRWIALSALSTTFWSQLYDSFELYHLKGPLAALTRCSQLRNFTSFYLSKPEAYTGPVRGYMLLVSRHGQKLKTLAISCVSDYTQTHVAAYINLLLNYPL